MHFLQHFYISFTEHLYIVLFTKNGQNVIYENAFFFLAVWSTFWIMDWIDKKRLKVLSVKTVMTLIFISGYTD